MRIRIRNGRVIDPANNINQKHDVYIADGRIVSVNSEPAGFTPDRDIDAGGMVVCPGLVDLRAHMREPGDEHKATIASETAAAASGGITTLCCTPDTDPVIDTPAVASLIHERAKKAGKARIMTIGALTQKLGGTHLAEMGALKAAGCVGVSNCWHPIENLLIQRRAMEYAGTHGLTVFLYAEDASLRNNGCMHEGKVSTRLGLPGIPEAAETVAVARDLALIQQTGIRAHFCGLSTARAIRMIARAQYEGVPVTADVTAHQLYLTEMDIGYFDSQCHVRPPLRTERDRDGLRQALAEGALLAICSDHQPHEDDVKLAPFRSTAPGISALETLLPLTLRLVDEDIFSYPEAIACLTSKPAKLLPGELGTLSVGATADVCVFDPEKRWELRADQMQSRGHNSPFLGWQFKGQVMMTLLKGKIVFERKA